MTYPKSEGVNRIKRFELTVSAQVKERKDRTKQRKKARKKKERKKKRKKEIQERKKRMFKPTQLIT